MILSNFSEIQIKNEIAEDMKNVLRYSDYKDGKFRRMVLKAGAFPVRMSFFYTSPRKNRWIVIYEARKKKEFGDYLRMTSVCLYRDSHGFTCAVMPTTTNGNYHFNFYPAHFFKRYKERNGNDATGEDLIREFFRLNFSYVYEFKESRMFAGVGNVAMTEVFGSCHEGVAMGVMTGEQNIIMRTFVSYDMLKGEQIDTFVKNEKIRKEIHESE